MFKNYLKIALRTLWRDKSYSIINIAGLSLGITCSILIFLLVQHHLSYDTYHAKADRTYRVVMDLKFGSLIQTPGVPYPFPKAFRQDFPEAEQVAASWGSYNTLVTLMDKNGVKQKYQEEETVGYVEPEFFQIFDYQWLKGNPKVLAEPDRAVITEKLAQKYFGKEDPMGKTLRVENEKDFVIAGVIGNIPANTDHRQELFLPYVARLSQMDKKEQEHWGGVSSGHQAYVVVPKNTTQQQLQAQLAATQNKYYKGEDKKTMNFVAQPLSDVHFNPSYNGAVQKSLIWALAIIGIFLILTACINFINLATAQAVNRAKEVGIRKVVGGNRRQLFWQFLLETGLLTLLAVGVSIFLAKLALPYVSELVQSELKLQFVQNPPLPLFLAATLLLVTFLSGAYPAMILAGFRPIEALKSKFATRQIGNFSLRRGLVVTQFVVSQLLIIAAIVVTSQVEYFKKADMGFNKDAIVLTPLPVQDKSKMQTLENQLLQVPGVQEVSFAFSEPASNNYNTTNLRFDTRQEDEKFQINTKPADDKYLETFGIQLVAGRNIFPSDTVREYLINETTVEKLGLKSPQEAIGKNLKVWGIDAPIVGVVKDFHNRSLSQTIEPVCIMSQFDQYYTCAAKISLSNVPATLKGIEKIWNAQFPDNFYEAQFLDERIAKFYEGEDIMMLLIRIFCGIAIFIGCLGLYGLVSYMAVRKTKEVGIRKVLGASVGDILLIFSKEFIKLVGIAFLIAAPLGWWAMNQWLQDYAYRINIGMGIFLLSIGATLIVVVLTVGYRSVQAATANPTKSLRSE